MFVRSDEVARPQPSGRTNRLVRSRPSVPEVPTDHAVVSSTRLRARAVDGNAMLSRIASILGPFDVDHFEYVVGAESDVVVVIGVRGDAWQVRRVAAKVDRLIGVHEVVIDPAD